MAKKYSVGKGIVDSCNRWSNSIWTAEKCSPSQPWEVNGLSSKRMEESPPLGGSTRKLSPGRRKTMKIYVLYNDEEDEANNVSLKFRLPQKWMDEKVERIIELFQESFQQRKPEIASLMKDIHLVDESGNVVKRISIIKKTIVEGHKYRIMKGGEPEIKEEDPSENGSKIRCKNPGCNKWFSESDNSSTSCQYHEGPPMFHDTKKGWTCCKKSAYDWDDFQEIEGCVRGYHSTQSLAERQIANSPTLDRLNQKEKTTPDNGSDDKIPVMSIQDYNKRNPQAVTAVSSTLKSLADSRKKCTRKPDGTADCLNKGCKTTFLVTENHEAACKYHSGNPVFHDRGKFWQCCPRTVKYDFDDFLTIAGCCVGPHNDGSQEYYTESGERK